MVHSGLGKDATKNCLGTNAVTGGRKVTNMFAARNCDILAVL